MEFSSFDSFNKGFADIEEPTIGKELTTKALIIVPAITVHKNGQRIGYGKGYYDRFMSQNPDHIYATLSLDRLIISENCFADHDIAVDFIITETAVMEKNFLIS